MIVFSIDEIKIFMAKLLVKDTFDQFWVEEAHILTASVMDLRGKRNQEWYDSEESGLPEWMYWSEVKNIVFEYIKGSRTPQVMKITLKASPQIAADLLKDSGVWQQYEKEMPGLALQIRFDAGELQIVTGIAHQMFSMDKSVEQAWDEAVKGFIRQI